MTADEAFANGLVTRVFPDEQFEEKVKEIVDQIGSLPPMVCISSIDVVVLLYMYIYHHVNLIISQLKMAIQVDRLFINHIHSTY